MKTPRAQADFEALAAVSFAEERRDYYEAVVAESKLQLLARQVEQGEQRLHRREGAGRWTAALDLPPVLAPIVGVMVYGATREHRRRAAEVIVRAVVRVAGDRTVA